MEEIYQLFCNKCGWKRVSDHSDAHDLFEIKTVDVPKGIPHIDPVNGSMCIPKSLKRKKKYRCPNCGFAVSFHKIENPQEEVKQNMNLQRRIQKRIENDEKERLKQLERDQKKRDRPNGGEASTDRRTL